jgi:hypothetical protein
MEPKGQRSHQCCHLLGDIRIGILRMHKVDLFVFGVAFIEGQFSFRGLGTAVPLRRAGAQQNDEQSGKDKQGEFYICFTAPSSPICTDNTLIIHRSPVG